MGMTFGIEELIFSVSTEHRRELRKYGCPIDTVAPSLNAPIISFSHSPQYLVVAVPPHSRRQSLHAEPDDDCAGGTAPGDAVLRQRGDGSRLAAGGARPSGLCDRGVVSAGAAGHILSQLPATLLLPEE